MLPVITDQQMPLGYVGTFITGYSTPEGGHYYNMWYSDGMYYYFLADQMRYRRPSKRDNRPKFTIAVNKYGLDGDYRSIIDQMGRVLYSEDVGSYSGDTFGVQSD